MNQSIYESMTDHQLWAEIVKLAKLKPEPKGSIRAIQSILEQRYLQELSADAPDQRRLSDLKLHIDGIDMSYLQDHTQHGTMEWRAKHPWPPKQQQGTAEQGEAETGPVE
ncbi:MAG TPA: hypothetical protein VH575_25185 [Gemmataceae bacterium]|jgi:hypothetical protein